jgi:type IV pilus assembly protein PilW
MTTQANSRGFTLIELLIAMLVGTIVVGAAVLLMVSQQRAFTSGADDRAMQEAGRLALEDMATNLRTAGYGIDPAMAFNFGNMANVPMDRAPPGTAVLVTGFACDTPVTCRDSATGSDELVFLSRDPAFNHLVAAPPTTSEVQIQGPLHVPLHPGQILQLACFSGTLDWAFVTVGVEVPVVTTSTPIPITLADGSGTDFPRQNGWLTRPCFQNGVVAALKVDRYRYFIGTYDAAGVPQAWGTPGARPFLMLDQGLTNIAGAILTMVAPDVEDLQVSYLFPSPRAPALSAVPAVIGTRLSNAAGGIELAPTAGVPGYATARSADSRLTNHPANIRGVRVSVTVRSAEKRVAEGSVQDNQIPAAGNRAAVAAPETGYRHLMFEATTVPFNLDSRTPFIPALSISAGADNLNVGGG